MTPVNKGDNSASQIFTQDNNNYFYVAHSNGYFIKISRKLQHYNSMETGLSLVITIDYRFSLNSCFMVYEPEFPNKLIGLSASSIQLLGISQKLIGSEKKFTDLFSVDQDSLT